ncbi:MAG: oligosaccharide repeat unit polymerase [Sedimentisphaerales bacterium]|nr:oligosaccharide repeat unit polymerase [Sedimentisphaerales bacterium]
MTQYVVNPLLLFLAVWTTAIALYVGGVCVGTFPSPQSALWVALVLNVGGFSLGYLTWAAFRRLVPPAHPTLSNAAVLSPDKIAHMLRITGLMGLAGLSLAVYRTTIIASHMGVSLGQLLTHPGMLRDGFAMFVTAGVFQTSWIVMLNSIVSSLFSIGFVLLGVFLYMDTSRRRDARSCVSTVYLCVFLLITLATGLMSVSRYEATVNIAYMVFAYCFVRGLDRRPVARRDARSCVSTMLIPLVAVIVLFLAIDLLLHKSTEYDRPDRVQGFLYHLFWYLASPLAAFNELLATFDGRHHFGQYTLFPFYKWLCRFHLAPETDISVFGEFLLLPYVANVYTYLRSFYEDFGMIGVTGGPYLLGLASSALRGVCSPQAPGTCRLQTTDYRLWPTDSSLRSPASGDCYLPYLNLYLVLLVFILFSFYNFFLFSNQVYLQVLFGFLLFRHNRVAMSSG